MFMDTNLQYENITSSRRKQGKRSLAVYETCKIELKNELNLLFNTFSDALKKSNETLLLFPTHSRSRTLEASIIQSCFAEVLINNFNEKAFYGKYKRLILRAKGYLILFKKLDKKGLPMNIKTINVQSILNQNQVLDLFAETDYNEDPILYFGYQKNRLGEFINPQIVYIDEGEINFTIGETDIQLEIIDLRQNTNTEQIEVKPKLKNSSGLRKIN